MKSIVSANLRGFALISVLAMVSLAALSATAFLASARLERLASRPLADVTRLEMACRTGVSMAMEITRKFPPEVGKPGLVLHSRVVTAWRTNEADDLGYLLCGAASGGLSNGLAMAYAPAFSTAEMARYALQPGSNSNSEVIVNLPGNFRSQVGTRMASWTNFGAANNATNLPTLGGAISPPVAWIQVYQPVRIAGTTNWTSAPAVRFAFFVEDLEGLIDGERMGGLTDRLSGTNPMEMSLGNLVNTSLTNSATLAKVTNPLNRPLFLTPGMLMSAGGLTTNDLRYVATGLNSWVGSAVSLQRTNVIPYGLPAVTNPAQQGYVNALTAKSNVATFNNAAAVLTLAQLIRNNLPHFDQRAGGLTNNNRFNYLSCLAANIKDYQDTDLNPTVLPGPGGYRGLEALPLVSEVALSIQWTNQLVVTNGNNKLYFEQFEVVHVVEFWNMFNKPFNGTVNFGYTSTLEAQWPQIPAFNLSKSALQTKSPGQLTNSYNVSLRPNEFRAYASPPIRYSDFRSGFVFTGFVTNIPKFNGKEATNGGSIIFGRQGSPTADNYNSSWTLSYGGVVYDQTTAIEEPTFSVYCEASPIASSAQKQPDFKNHQPALRLDPPSGTVATLFGTGDLRITYFTTNNVNPNATGIFNASTFDESASLGYRNTIWAYTDRKGSTNRPDLWPDGGHANSSPGPGKVPGLDTRVWILGADPTSTNASNTLALLNPAFRPALAVTYPTAPATASEVASAAPAYIADAPMTNVLELGRIFDPIQWQTAVPMTPAVPQAANPTNITGTSVADFQQGGGNTLRVGRAEHPRFAFSGNFGADPVPFLGQSANAFLDLFVATNVNTVGESAGRINLNTAPRPVLAALAGGVLLTNDPNMTGSPVNTTMINTFTQGVCRFRMLYPFQSASQLPFISTDYGTNYTTTPVGSWTNRWPTNAVFTTNSGLAGVTAINDAGVEEWFSKIYGLAGTTSQNFRCYVVAQLTTTNGSPRGAPYRRYYQFYLTPYGGANGSWSATITQEGSY